MKLVIAVSMLINPRRCLVEHTTSQGVNFSKDGAVSKLSYLTSWYVSKKKKKKRARKTFTLKKASTTRLNHPSTYRAYQSTAAIRSPVLQIEEHQTTPCSRASLSPPHVWFKATADERLRMAQHHCKPATKESHSVCTRSGQGENWPASANVS